MKTMTIDPRNLAYLMSQVDQLRKIARTVRIINTNACNYELSKAQETRRENLETKASEIAAWFEMDIYHQRDPRGPSLYLIPRGMDHDQAMREYSSIGMALY